MEHSHGEMEQPLLPRGKQQYITREGFVKYMMVSECLDGVAYRATESVLGMYLLEALDFGENGAAQLVHLFLLWEFFSGLIGSVTSDGFLGQFRTIYMFAVMEICGYTILTFLSVTTNFQCWQKSNIYYCLIIMALLFVAMGHGASRPSMATFGGDQTALSIEKKSGGHGSELEPSRKRIACQQYFSAAFFSSKLGYVVGNILGPNIRVHSAGSFFLVFLVPACAKAMSVFSFLVGKREYQFKSDERRSDKTAATGISQAVTKLIGGEVELSADCCKRSWEDWKSLMSAIVVVSPALLYVALGFQILSTWVFQACKMNGDIGMAPLGHWTIPPDQMPVLSQLFTLMFIPLLDSVVYPFVEKNIVKLTNLKKYVLSFVWVTFAFVLTGFVQIAIEYAKDPSTGIADISILWQIPQYVVVALGEAMHIIPFTNFSYSEAPESMKSAINGVVRALSGGLGNAVTIAVITTLGSSASKVEEIFVFACLGAVGTILVTITSYRYVPLQKRLEKKKLLP